MALRETLNANFKQLSEENKVNNGYLTGGVSTEKKMLEQVKEMRRSTFDLSKFEVVGNPTTTDDGVAVKIAGNGYFKIPSELLADKTNYIVNIAFTMPEEIKDYHYIFAQGSGNATGFSIYYLGRNLFIRTDVSTSRTIIYDNLKAFDTIKLSIIYKDSAMTAVLDVNSTKTEHTITLGDYAPFSLDNIYLGTRNNIIFGPDAFPGSIDLKQFSIEVDGVEVLNGNKTGIDQIKKDAYTEYNNPIIREDGIYTAKSNTSDGLHLNLKWSDLKDKSWKIVSLLYNNGLKSNNEQFSFFFVDGRFGPRVTWNKLYWYMTIGVTGDLLENWAYMNVNVPENAGWYFIELEFNYNTGEYTISLKDINKTLLETQTAIPTTTNKEVQFINTRTDNINLCGAYSSNTNLGSTVDLNALKIYIDGNLVYQPTLKIPYTQSKTGSKIVDSQYRDRVEQVYDEQGSANYYTLSETDFTLPIGEIYGMKADKSEVDGQWVSTGEITIASNVSVTSNVTGPTYDLSAYLPEDNYNYEILLQCLIESTTTLNNFFYISVDTGIILTELCRVRTTATSNSTNASSTTVLPIDVNRQLTLLYSTSTNFRGKINSITLKAYRRLGTNK